MAHIKGKGSILQCAFVGAIYTTIAQRVEISGPSMTVETTDATHLDSSAREHVSTITDFGEISLTAHYDPDNSTHSSLTDLISTPETKNWKLHLMDDTNTIYTFAGILTGFEVGGMTVDGLVSASISIKISGAVTIA